MRGRASNSLALDELQVLQMLCRCATLGQDTRVLVRHKAFVRAYDKIARMRARAEMPLEPRETLEAPTDLPAPEEPAIP